MELSSKYRDVLPSFSAPAGGELTPEMLDAYKETGVIILEDFVSAEACAILQERALQLVEEFDPNEVRSIFSATEQTQLNDRYFYESGDKIRFFLEYDAFDDAGNLIQAKEAKSSRICRNSVRSRAESELPIPDLSSQCISSNRLVLAAKSTSIRTRPSFTPNLNHALAFGSRWKTRRSRMVACISYRRSTAVH
jgi:hypothetical protein